MNRTLVPLLALLALTPGCPPARQCEFNSSCPTGRYCSAAGTCTADCTMDTECGSGRVCNSFGMCVSGNPDPDDTGTFDAGRVPVDTGMLPIDTGIFDAGRVPIDTGMLPIDTGMLGVDADRPAMEVCTPSTEDAVAMDEDRDGAVDEGCAWHLGNGHWMSQVDVPHEEQLSPTISMDGLRLYFTGYGFGSSLPPRMFVASRPAVNAPFGSAVAVPLPATVVPERTSVRFDELEVIVGGGVRFWGVRRASTSEPFTSVVELPFGGYDPSLSRDGLELIYSAVGATGTLTLHIARRSAISENFIMGTPVSIPDFPPTARFVGGSFSNDGLSIFFNSGLDLLFSATRSSRTSLAFAPAVDLSAEVPGAAENVVSFSPVSREMFFGINGGWRAGVGRAEVCRDGACARKEVMCSSAAGEVRSPDGFHCFIPRSTSRDWHAAFLDCVSLSTGAQTAHLATIQSSAENTLVRSLIGSNRAWLGGYDGTPTADLGLPSVPQCSTATPGCSFAWVTGEPWTYAPWSSGEPNNSNGGHIEDGLILGWPGVTPGEWNDFETSFAWTSICERELWPVW